MKNIYLPNLYGFFLASARPTRELPMSNSVELADEDIAQDPPRTHRQVESHEAGDTLGLSGLGKLQDVIHRTQGERFPSDDNINIRHVRNLGANDEELSASRNQLDSANHLVDGICFSGGTNHET